MSVMKTDITRRCFAAGAACAALAACADAKRGKPAMKEIALPPLPYAEDALAPVISAKTISYHYGKHHAGYIKTLNGLISGTHYETLSLSEMVGLSRELNDPGIFNNAAQAWNHDFYWHSLAPAGKGGEPSAGLLKAINESFGSLDNCKKALSHAATRQFGSGWAWLVAKGGKLLVESTGNADTPCRQQYVKPLLTIDVWEHAYYLDWQNNRAAYVKAIVDGHLNWSAASSRFASA